MSERRAVDMTFGELVAEVAKKDAEIERLKKDHQIVRDFLDAADAKLLKHEKLITELCDALEDESFQAADHPLVKRARGATR